MPFYEETGMDFRIRKSEYKQWPAYNEAHFHECYEFYYLMEGSVLFYVGDTVYTLEKGDVVFLPPGMPHKTRPNQEESFKNFLMCISPEYIEDFIQNAPSLYSFFHKGNHIKLNEEEQGFTVFVLHKILDEFGKTPSHDDRVIRAYIAALFLSLNDCLKKGKDNTSTHAGMISENMQKILDYMNRNYADEITLHILAKEFYLHPSYISNMIKKNLGVSFVKYLNRLRIQKSLKLLLTTDYKIEDISAMCGFNSSSHYCKTFASFLSVSPMQYRKMRKESKENQK